MSTVSLLNSLIDTLILSHNATPHAEIIATFERNVAIKIIYQHRLVYIIFLPYKFYC